MRLYLDQMLRVELAQMLQSAGHDVLRAAEAGQERADDSRVIERAISEGRTLITLDDDFGNPTVVPLRCHPGVIRLKIHPTTVANAASLLLPFLAKHPQADLANQLVIITRARVRWIRTA